jgi:hypothetical protein
MWLVSLGFAILGGSIFARLMLYFPSSAAGNQAYQILYAAFKGSAATALALESSYVVASLVLGLWGWSAYRSECPAYVAVLLAFLDVQLYGMGPLMQSVLLGLLYGSLAGFVILKAESKYGVKIANGLSR